MVMKIVQEVFVVVQVTNMTVLDEASFEEASPNSVGPIFLSFTDSSTDERIKNLKINSKV